VIISGRAVLLALLGAIPFAIAPSPVTVLFWALCVLVLCIVDAILAASPRRVGIRREVFSPVRLSQQTTSTLTLTNLNSRTLRGLIRDAWQPTMGAQPSRISVKIPTQESRRTTTHLLPSRRGDIHAGGVTIRAMGPLGIAGRQATIAVDGKVRVLPEFRARRHLPSKLARLREMDGAASVQVRGQGTEFDSLREYVPGDDVRSIDWRATARRAEVVVRTWRPERDRRVLIVVDSSRTSAARVGDAPRLEASLEAALLLGALTARAGDRVGLLAVDREVRAQVPSALGTEVLSKFAEALTPIEPELVEADWPRVAELIQERLSQRALVVLLTALDPAAIESGLLPVIGRVARDHQVVVASVGDPQLEEMRQQRGDAEEVFLASAAERIRLERFNIGQQLARIGVEVIEESPEDLAPKLADTYLALKAAGKL